MCKCSGMGKKQYEMPTQQFHKITVYPDHEDKIVKYRDGRLFYKATNCFKKN